MIKLPCENCPVLAICVAKKTIKCKLLLKALEYYMNNEPYSNTAWSDTSKLIKKVLRGNWHIMVIIVNCETQISSIKKYDLTDKTFKEEGTHELFHII